MDWWMWLILIVAVLLLLGLVIFSRRKTDQPAENADRLETAADASAEIGRRALPIEAPETGAEPMRLADAPPAVEEQPVIGVPQAVVAPEASAARLIDPDLTPEDTPPVEPASTPAPQVIDATSIVEEDIAGTPVAAETVDEQLVAAPEVEPEPGSAEAEAIAEGMAQPEFEPEIAPEPELEPEAAVEAEEPVAADSLPEPEPGSAEAEAIAEGMAQPEFEPESEPEPVAELEVAEPEIAELEVAEPELIAEPGPAEEAESPAVEQIWDGPFGPGSAEAGPDGEGPAGWTVKGARQTKVYLTPETPVYQAARANVWFVDEERAIDAGFRRWDTPS